LQELTRKTVALHLVAKVKKMSDRIDEKGKVIASAALSTSLDLAAAILDQILAELKGHDQFETTIRRRSSLWDYFHVICDRGPPAMDTYFYLYGLLDCATQLSRILSYDQIKDEFKVKMMTIIRQSGEESYRWKAVSYHFPFMRNTMTKLTSRCWTKAEFLLADTRIRTSEVDQGLRQVLQECQQKVPMVMDVLSDCFCEEESLPLPKRNNSSSLSQVGSFSSSGDTLVMMSPEDWIERPFDPFAISSEAQEFSVRLGDGRRSKKIRYQSAGLSPECTFAFLLSKVSIGVYSLQSLPLIRQVPVQDRLPKDLEYKEAVLSERLLAIITRQDVRVFELTSLHDGYCQVGMERFEADSAAGTYFWDPNCLAIHQDKGWAWISVGGRENHNGIFYGSIKIYHVDLGSSRPTTIVRHIANFNSPDPDALANDFLKAMDFSPDGRRLACVTNKNRVLTWLLSNDARPSYPPFQIKKRYKRETKACGVTSARLFYSPSSRPYILSTTSPSTERVRNGGEWTYISPVSDIPSLVPKELDQDLCQLGNAGAILTGAASASGDVVALLEETGTVLLFPLARGKIGGLALARCQQPIRLDRKLSKQEKASTTSLRFCAKGRNGPLHLYAIDIKGNIVWKCFDQRQSVPL
jgi:hypothetical protein